MNYSDVFGSNTLPPSEYGYTSLIITTDTVLVWPCNADSTSSAAAKIMDVSCGAGNILTLPDATLVSTGEDFLIRNVGANDLTVKDSTGVMVATVIAGAAKYFYLTNNSSAAGVFAAIAFGVGTSTIDAASLVGYGMKAIGATLNQSHPVLPMASSTTIDASHRSKLVVFTGGTGTFSLTTAATMGDDFFALIRNDGTGTLTIDPAASELIDSQTTMQLQPSESLILVCTGTQWYTVGFGRSVLYQFTQLTKDVSAGGTITLSASEASNKLITFVGNPSGAITVIAPSVVAVYYTYSNISTAQTITFKTTTGSGVGIDQGSRIIALCDGTNMLSAQSATANASVSLSDGSSVVPALFFATKTNTGLFKSGTQDLGVTVNGSNVGVFTATGLNGAAIGSTTPAAGSFTTLSASGNVTLGDASTDTLNVGNGGLIKDASGNLGLGVTPSAWGASYKALQVNRGSVSNVGGTVYFGANFYYNGTNSTYIATDYASLYGMADGQHRWYTAPSGTAGNPITFTQAMTLDASGNLLVGGAPNPTGAKVNLTIDGSLQNRVISLTNTQASGRTYQILNGGNGADASVLRIYDATADATRVTLDASGNFMVGTTGNTTNGGLFVQPGTTTNVETAHGSGASPGSYYHILRYNGIVIGSITQSGTTAVAYNTTSDHRLKENVRPANAARFNDIEFVDFEWVDGRHDCGVIAHQLQSVYPDLVIGEKDATEIRQVEVTSEVKDAEGNIIQEAIFEDREFPVYQQVNYIGLIGRMGTRIQLQDKAIQELESRLAALENK